jgi:hypothetical protein
MVAYSWTPAGAARPIDYNEKKVRAGAAKCIYSANFLKDTEELTVADKKRWFEQFIALNQRRRYNTLHFAIGFVPGEPISTEMMIDIGNEFMNRIGFGDQPYLIYQHFDTAVPHFHIVTTTIRFDGSFINLNFIGRDKIDPARKALEEKYGLIKAGGPNKSREANLKPFPAERLQYGKRPTKQAITNVLEHVLTTYKYRSLLELNAILKLFNLRANGGRPGNWLHRHGGLTYQVLNDKGKGASKPVKASSIYFKPGLKWLQKHFKANQQEIDPAIIQRIRMAIDNVIAKSRAKGWTAFTEALAKEQLAAIPYLNPKKSLDALSFVDLNAKLVLKASELAPGYCSQDILRRLNLDHFLKQLPRQMDQSLKENKSIQKSLRIRR